MSYRFALLRRSLCTTRPQLGLTRPSDPGSAHIYDKLVSSSLSPTSVEVVDISGGCGASYSIAIASGEFRGKPAVQQQRLVNRVLKEELQRIHAVQLKCTVPQT